MLGSRKRNNIQFYSVKYVCVLDVYVQVCMQV